MRRVTTQILRAPWKEALSRELRPAFGSEMMVTAIEKPTHSNKPWSNLTNEQKAEMERLKRNRREKSMSEIKDYLVENYKDTNFYTSKLWRSGLSGLCPDDYHLRDNRGQCGQGGKPEST